MGAQENKGSLSGPLQLEVLNWVRRELWKRGGPGQRTTDMIVQNTRAFDINVKEWHTLSTTRSDWQKQTSCLTKPLSWLSTIPRLSKLRRDNNTTKSGQITEVEVKTKGKSNKDPWRTIQPLTWSTNTHNWLSEAKDQFVQDNWTTLGQEKCWQQKIGLATQQEKGMTKTPLTWLSTSRKLIAKRLSCLTQTKN